MEDFQTPSVKIIWHQINLSTDRNNINIKNSYLTNSNNKEENINYLNELLKNKI